MRRVAVVHQDGRVLRTYSIDFGNLDREPQDHWYFKQARENAIADKLVRPQEANQLICRFEDDPGEGRSRGGVTSVTEQTHLGRLAKTLAWAAAVAAIIATVWAVISLRLYSS